MIRSGSESSWCRVFSPRKRCVDLLTALVAMAALVPGGPMQGVAEAEIITWAGLNAAETTADDVTDASLWDAGRVPGPGDTAVFAWTGVAAAYRGDVLIGGTGGEAFAPNHLVHDSSGFTLRGGDVRVVGPVELATLTLATGWTDSLRGRLIVGDGGTLGLTGEHPLTFAGHQGGWGAIVVEAGGVLELAGPVHRLEAFNAGWWHDRDGMYQGFKPLAGQGAVAVTMPGAVVVLGDPGERFYRQQAEVIEPLGYVSDAWGGPEVAPALHVGAASLHVRSDQIWLSEAGTGVVRLRGRAGEPVVHSIDGGPLLNLEQVALEVDHSGGVEPVLLGEMRLQSLVLRGSEQDPAVRDELLVTGPVELVGGVVVAGHGGDAAAAVEPVPAWQDQDGLLLSYRGASGGRLVLGGHELRTSRGARLEHHGDDAGDGAAALIDASGSQLVLGGDLVYQDAGRPAGQRRLIASQGVWVLDEGRRVGIHGDAATVIELAGDLVANTRSPTGPGLSAATLRLVGQPGQVRQVEVAAAPGDALGPGTWGIGRLEVGEALTVRLVNEHVNDGPVHYDAQGSAWRSKEGEVLLTGDLAIAEQGRLDLAGQSVVLHGRLTIDAGGVLDLPTGTPLSVGDVVPAFAAAGDQRPAWQALADHVLDSTNEPLSFTPHYEQGWTRWQVAGNWPLLGDMNLDGVVDTGDVAVFVQALVDPAWYLDLYGIEPMLVGDINADGAFDTGDVAAFVQLLVAGVAGGAPGAGVPEPGGGLWLVGVLWLLGARRR